MILLKLENLRFHEKNYLTKMNSHAVFFVAIIGKKLLGDKQML